MDGVLADVLARRRDRAIGAILGVKEREADPHLPPDAARKLRKVVLDQLNDYHSMVTDILGSLLAAQEEDGAVVVLNGHWLEKIAAIHDAVVGNGSG